MRLEPYCVAAVARLGYVAHDTPFENLLSRGTVQSESRSMCGGPLALY